jgi:glutathione S-transferase
VLPLDAGDLKSGEFDAFDPGRRAPILVADNFVLAESAAIVEYVEDR